MGFLDEIIPEVRSSVRGRDYLPEPLDAASGQPASFREAVRPSAAGMSCVVEYKRRSPGYTDVPLPDLPPKDFARVAEAAGASAISCVACVPRFDGSPSDVAAVARSSTLPVLFKDFVVDPRQVEAAARAGASAVLLIARLESEGRLDTPLSDLNAVAHARGLETLLELHLPEDLRVAGTVSADVFGVNVRDLDTLRMEPGRAEEVLRAAWSHRPLLGLSGVQGPEEVEWFRKHGADGFLVGTAVRRAADPEAFISKLAHAGRVALP